MDNNKSIIQGATRLGRGLAALIPPTINKLDETREKEITQDKSSESALEIPLTAITPNTLQPRQVFDTDALADLAESIKAHGVLQPVLVRPSRNGKYELVAGERRFRAAEIAGLDTIPSVVRPLTDEESLTVALIENIQREDLNPVETARGYRQLMADFGLTQTQLGSQIGKKQSTISNALRLLHLPQDILENIAAGLLTEAHGKALLSLPNPDQQQKLGQEALRHGWSVKETQEQVNRLLHSDSLTDQHPRATPAQVPATDIHWDNLLSRVRSAFSMRVSVKTKPNGSGTLMLDFSSPEEIEGILDRIR